MAEKSNNVTISNDEEYEAAMAAAERYKLEQDAEKKRLRDEKLQQLRDFVNSDEFEPFVKKLEELTPIYANEDGINAHLRPAPQFLRRLQQAAV